MNTISKKTDVSNTPALNSHVDVNGLSRGVFESQIRECFGRVVYSHKTHEKSAEILLSSLNRVKLGQIILSALMTGGFIATIVADSKIVGSIGALLSSVLLILNSYLKSFDHGELAQKHRQMGSELWMIRERYFTLLTDIVMSERPLEELQKERDLILCDLSGIYEKSPATNGKAYIKAQEALKNKEDLTFSDQEIDCFLPGKLKSSR